MQLPGRGPRTRLRQTAVVFAVLLAFDLAANAVDWASLLVVAAAFFAITTAFDRLGSRPHDS